MEVGSGNDKTVDSFVSPDDAVDLDLPFTPRSTEVLIFQSKMKEKAKVTDSSHDPELEADIIAGSKPSTALSGAGLCSVETEQDVDRDAVVREISVFCGSGNVGEDTQLYVVQHVLRGAWRPYELNKRCEEIRWKPKQQKMEVDLRMDHENYDQERSKPLNLKKQTLSSTTMISSRIQYAIGFLEKNKFHLNPVHAILQLRPSFASLLDDLPKEEMVSETAEASSNPIMPWVVLQYHPIDSPLSYKIKQKMAAEVVRNAQFMLTRSDYLHSLPSRKLADETVARAPSMRVLHHKPLEERLKQWFCERNQVNTFDALKHLAYGYSEDDLLKLLPSYANLVQGLWVCKSSLLYSGSEAILRDYILFLFNKKDTIQYHKLREIKLDPSVFQSMMGALAYDRKLLGDWKFKQSKDVSFIKSYPDIVKEHENAWLAHENYSIRKLGKKVSMMVGSQASDSVETKTEHNADLSIETHEHIRWALLELFNYRSVLSFQSIVSGLQEIACRSSPKKDLKTRLLSNSAALAVSAPVEDLHSVIDQVAVRVHGVYVIKPAGNQALDPLRNVVISLYQEREPNVTLRKKEIKQAAQLCLKIDIPDYEYYQVMHELCITKNGSWELRSGE